MFSSIDDQIGQTQGRPFSRMKRLLRQLCVLGVTAVLFGSLYPGILMLE